VQWGTALAEAGAGGAAVVGAASAAGRSRGASLCPKVMQQICMRSRIEEDWKTHSRR